MFAFIRGKLVTASPPSVILDVQGIGYELFVPSSHFSLLPALGSEVTLHAVLVIRDMSQTLYGFVTWRDKHLFEQLLGVTGIGPKLALSLLGHLTSQELCEALSCGDVACLTRVPGIGKRTAERLILELKDKPMASMFDEGGVLSASMPLRGKVTQDAVSALMRLGYHQSQAHKAVQQSLTESAPDIALADLVATALRHV